MLAHRAIYQDENARSEARGGPGKVAQHGSRTRKALGNIKNVSTQPAANNDKDMSQKGALKSARRALANITNAASKQPVSGDDERTSKKAAVKDTAKAMDATKQSLLSIESPPEQLVGPTGAEQEAAEQAALQASMRKRVSLLTELFQSVNDDSCSEISKDEEDDIELPPAPPSSLDSAWFSGDLPHFELPDLGTLLPDDLLNDNVF